MPVPDESQRVRTDSGNIPALYKRRSALRCPGAELANSLTSMDRYNRGRSRDGSRTFHIGRIGREAGLWRREHAWTK